MNQISCIVILTSYKNNIKESIEVEAPASMNMEDLQFMIKRDFPNHNITAINRKANMQVQIKPKYCFAIITDGNRAIAEVKNGLIHLFGGGSEGSENANQCMFRELNEELRKYNTPFAALSLGGAFDARKALYQGNEYLEMFYLIEVEHLDQFSHGEGGTMITFDFTKETIERLKCDDAARFGLLSAYDYWQ